MPSIKTNHTEIGGGKLLLSAAGIRRVWGLRTVLDISRLEIYAQDRIGLIGENGAGKSTLLKILAGEEEPDGGSVRRLCGTAFIHQSGSTEGDGSAAMRAMFRTERDREGLSGGEETRRRVAMALSQQVPLLFADEPTTDLDREGARMLRKELKSFPGALVLVSHDRALLEENCRIIWHLQDGTISVFPGTYSAWREEQKRRREFQAFEYDQYRAEKKRLEGAMQQKREWASSVRKAPKRMGNSEARLHTREYTNAVLKQSKGAKTLQDRIDRLEVKERPREDPPIRMALGRRSPIRAHTALAVRVSFLAAGGKELIRDSAFVLPSGTRTALIGPNGAGKTTLLRAIAGKTAPDVVFRGEAAFNPAARWVLFDQSHERALDPEKTVLENVLSDPSVPEADARTVLARLNLRGDAVFKKTGVLSGGERAKTALARVLLSDANLIILDEPTNHLDVFTLEALEDLLKDYGGTLLFVSHDEALLRACATRVIRLEKGRLVTWEGTMDGMHAEERRDREKERADMDTAILEMRLAALAARLTAPMKGDRPEELEEQYFALAEQLKEARRSKDQS
ncbi:MAG: ABC-F family ATP-binding cassette domain-containing protein [Clostridia bacterium]|nr:ABC-F family ATP-binding cassette domain-containing protein [Clostridia bacterium]